MTSQQSICQRTAPRPAGYGGTQSEHNAAATPASAPWRPIRQHEVLSAASAVLAVTTLTTLTTLTADTGAGRHPGQPKQEQEQRHG
jgi:hypothetical protein